MLDGYAKYKRRVSRQVYADVDAWREEKERVEVRCGDRKGARWEWGRRQRGRGEKRLHVVVEEVCRGVRAARSGVPSEPRAQVERAETTDDAVTPLSAGRRPDEVQEFLPADHVA
eukprot:6243598-Pyramimonas_sp.AAC.1